MFVYVLFVSPATKSIPPDADDLEPEAKRKQRWNQGCKPHSEMTERLSELITEWLTDSPKEIKWNDMIQCNDMRHEWMKDWRTHRKK